MTIIRFAQWSPGRKNSPGWIVARNGCHIWVGAKVRGYGNVKVDGRSQLVHRVRYEREVGPIPEGHDLDHYVCNNGAGGCCNPHHCRPVTSRENTLRGNTIQARNLAKTHCPKGHPLAGDNLVQSQLPKRRNCRTCHNTRRRVLTSPK